MTDTALHGPHSAEPTAEPAVTADHRVTAERGALVSVTGPLDTAAVAALRTRLDAASARRDNDYVAVDLSGAFHPEPGLFIIAAAALTAATPAKVAPRTQRRDRKTTRTVKADTHRSITAWPPGPTGRDPRQRCGAQAGSEGGRGRHPPTTAAPAGFHSSAPPVTSGLHPQKYPNLAVVASRGDETRGHREGMEGDPETPPGSRAVGGF